MSKPKKSRSKVIFTGQWWKHVPPKPTQSQLMSQVYHGLREAGWKWRERRLSKDALEIVVRRARKYPYFTDVKIEEITGIPLQEIKEIE